MGAMNILPSTIKDIPMLVVGIRPYDAFEARAMHGWDPFDAFYYSWQASTHAWTAHYHGEPVAMFGYNAPGLAGERAELWMLGTRCLDVLWLSTARAARLLVDYLLTLYPVLTNRVHVGNGPALDLLAWLGASFGPPVNCGVGHAPFVTFEIRRN